MKIYLDNCSFNRPFDDQTFMRIKLETDAKLYIQEQVKHGALQLTWSYGDRFIETCLMVFQVPDDIP